MLYAIIMVCWASGKQCAMLHSEHGFADRADCVEWIGLTIERLQAPYDVRLVGCHERENV